MAGVQQSGRMLCNQTTELYIPPRVVCIEHIGEGGRGSIVAERKQGVGNDREWNVSTSSGREAAKEDWTRRGRGMGRGEQREAGRFFRFGSAAHERWWLPRKIDTQGRDDEACMTFKGWRSKLRGVG